MLTVATRMLGAAGGTRFNLRAQSRLARGKGKACSVAYESITESRASRVRTVLLGGLCHQSQLGPVRPLRHWLLGHHCPNKGHGGGFSSHYRGSSKAPPKEATPRLLRWRGMAEFLTLLQWVCACAMSDCGIGHDGSLRLRQGTSSGHRTRGS